MCAVDRNAAQALLTRLRLVLRRANNAMELEVSKLGCDISDSHDRYLAAVKEIKAKHDQTVKDSNTSCTDAALFTDSRNLLQVLKNGKSGDMVAYIEDAQNELDRRIVTKGRGLTGTDLSEAVEAKEIAIEEVECKYLREEKALDGRAKVLNDNRKQIKDLLDIFEQYRCT